jgi:broad specificity phosphatase PhoE
MSDIKLFFIRHAFSCGNYKNTKSIFGYISNLFVSDPHLSDLGKDQITSHKHYISNIIKPHYVISSSLLRAIQTAQGLFPEFTVHVSPYISETGFGLSNAPVKPSDQSKYLDDPSKVKYLYLGKGDDLDKLYSARKSKYLRPDFQKFLKWLSRVSRKKTENGPIRIAVVSHGNFIKKMLLDQKLVKSIGPIKNLCVAEIQLSRGQDGDLVISSKSHPIIFEGIPYPKANSNNC